MKDAVYELQEYLRNISRYDKDIPFTVSDGIFGKETTEAVIAFQEKYSLEPTGKVNFETWEKLTEINDEAIFFFSSPLMTAEENADDFPLKKGKESSLNTTLNLMLSHLAALYSNFETTEVLPIFTEETEEQIRNFQLAAGIEATGEADKRTWNELAWLFLNISQSTPDTAD